jgi:hypothetical protein
MYSDGLGALPCTREHILALICPYTPYIPSWARTTWKRMLTYNRSMHHMHACWPKHRAPALLFIYMYTDRPIYAICMYTDRDTHTSIDLLIMMPSMTREKLSKRVLWWGDASGRRQGEECCVHGLGDDKGKKSIGRRHSRYSDNTSCPCFKKKLTVVAQCASSCATAALDFIRNSWESTCLWKVELNKYSTGGDGGVQHGNYYSLLPKY